MRPGTTTAVVGTTGSGEDDAHQSVAVLLHPGSGSIRINDTDVTELGRAGVRSMIAAVAQEPWLFTGSVAETTWPTVSGETDGQDDERELRLAEAIVDSHVGQIVSVLPDGLDTVVGHDGGNLSAGELQLVTVARAIAAQPRILVLDRATSSADPHRVADSASFAETAEHDHDAADRPPPRHGGARRPDCCPGGWSRGQMAVAIRD